MKKQLKYSIFDIQYSIKGSTIVELLLYIGLLAIFLTVLTDILVSTLAVKSESEATSTVHQDGRFLLARFFYDVQRASEITTPANLGESGNTLVATIDGASYSYSLSEGNLYLNGPVANAPLNGSEVSVTDFSVTKIGNAGGKETVKIQFTLESKTQRAGGPEVRSFQTTVGLR